MPTRLEQIIQPFVGTSTTPAKQGTLQLPKFTPYVVFRVKATGGAVKSGYGKQTYTFYAVKHSKEKTTSGG